MTTPETTPRTRSRGRDVRRRDRRRGLRRRPARAGVRRGRPQRRARRRRRARASSGCGAATATSRTSPPRRSRSSSPSAGSARPPTTTSCATSTRSSSRSRRRSRSSASRTSRSSATPPPRSASACAPASSSCSSRRRTPGRPATSCCRSSSGSRGSSAGKDFHLAFSPERVDPGRTDWTTKTVPKVVGGIDDASTDAAAALYGSAVDTIHRVSSPEAAELTKLLENIYRSVNIALVNELAQLCDRMGIDIWEVVDAAATKPFGFAAFQPGPGPRRPLHPDRPLLPHVEGAGVRLRDAVHRARGRGQPEHAVLLPLARLAGAEPRRAQVARGLARPRPRRGVQGGHLRLARVAGREADRAPPERRRRRRLPRPARAVVRGRRDRARRPCRSSRPRTTRS